MSSWKKDRGTAQGRVTRTYNVLVPVLKDDSSTVQHITEALAKLEDAWKAYRTLHADIDSKLEPDGEEQRSNLARYDVIRENVNKIIHIAADRLEEITTNVSLEFSETVKLSSLTQYL